MSRLVRPLALGSLAALVAAVLTWRLGRASRSGDRGGAPSTMSAQPASGFAPGPSQLASSRTAADATASSASDTTARVTYDLTLDGPTRLSVPTEVDRDEPWATEMEGFLAKHGQATLEEFMPDATWESAYCFSTTCRLMFTYDPTLRDEMRVVYNFVAVGRYRPSEETTNEGMTRASLVVEYLDRASGDRQTPERFLEAERAMPLEYHQFREHVKRELAKSREP